MTSIKFSFFNDPLFMHIPLLLLDSRSSILYVNYNDKKANNEQLVVLGL